MGGLKSLIRKLVPYTWECILREERVFSRYVDLVYLSHCGVPKNGTRSKESTLFCIKRLKEAVKEDSPITHSRDFIVSFNGFELCSKSEYEEWQRINIRIQNLKEICR